MENTQITNEKSDIGISANNFQTICRFCLIGSPEVKLFADDENTFLYKFCIPILSITVDPNDELPLNICKQCELKVLNFHEFKQSVLEVQRILTKTLVEHKNGSTLRSTIDDSFDDETKERCTGKENIKRKYECRFCKKVFNKSLDYREHINTEREKRKELFSLCTICKKLFAKGKLIAHMKIHTTMREERNYQCDICGKKYRTKRNLCRHSLIHTGMPHVCEVCGKGFRESNLLRDHLNTHSGLTPHFCSICGSSYPTSSALRLHKANKHTGKERKIYKYPKKINKNHIKKTKKRSFPCEICGKVYATKAVVNYHVLTHSGEKTFQCNDCGKMFANKSILE